MLESHGWVMDRQRGSHAHFVNKDYPGRITTVPMSHGEIKIGTLKNIERQSGLKFK
jgi:predicted RNA binding protein YcfA (HicA-like mRNA interferase family)